MLKHSITGGVKGEFEGVVRRADGSIKETIPLQENLITKNGMLALNNKAYFTKSSAKMTGYVDFGYYLALGTGSGTVAENDIDLFAVWGAPRMQVGITDTVENPNSEHPNHVVSIRRAFFRITNGDTNGVNLTELGFASTTDANYALFTHALIKDVSNAPTAITLLPGEILELNYYIKFYWDIRQTKQDVEVTTIQDGNETKESYTVLFGIYNTPNPQLAWQGSHIGGIKYIRALAPKEALDTNTDAWSMETVTYPKYANFLANKAVSLQRGGDADYPEYNDANWKKNNYPSSYHLNIYNNDPDTLTKQTTQISLSPYFGVANNGIRVLAIGMPTPNGYNSNSTATVYVAFFRKSDGAALMKTATQILSFTLDFFVTRWDGN